MQKNKVTIHTTFVSNGISIIFKETDENPHQREFMIEIGEEEQKQYKSLYYVEKFPIYEKREIISKWINGYLTHEELIELIP